MQALPAIAPDLGTWHQVTLHRDCHVKFDYRLYSAPFALVGKVLWLRAMDGAVALYDEFRHVATHARGLKPGERKTIRDHLPPQAQAFFARDREWLASQAALIGTACAQLIEPKSGSYPVAGNTVGWLKVPSVGAILSLT